MDECLVTLGINPPYLSIDQIGKMVDEIGDEMVNMRSD